MIKGQTLPFNKNYEKVSLEIVDFYLREATKNLSLPIDKTIFSTDFTRELSGELQASLANTDHDEVLEYLSMTCKAYHYIYKKLKNNNMMRKELRNHLPHGQMKFEDICYEIEESYYPRNAIVRLYCLEKLGPSKIAARLGININTVKYHLRYLSKKYTSV